MESIEKHVIFRIKDQLFTLNVAHVSSIIQLPKIYKVPQSSDFILGVINVGGHIVPVIDAAIKMNMGKIVIDEKLQIVILQHRLAVSEKLHLLGFLVDEVRDVADVKPRSIQPLPTSKYEFDERFVDGIHKIENEFCMQVNIGNFFKEDIEDMLENQKSIITQN